MIETPAHISQLPLVCPTCGSPLDFVSEDLARCPIDSSLVRKEVGIWQAVAPEREAYFERFVAEYDHVRRMEGRGAASPSYFRNLPFADTSRRFSSDWRVRAASYTCFVDRVLEQHVRERAGEQRRLRILDLGAGNCWLSNRLAERGHVPVAVDLRMSTEDGLAAHCHYESRFEVVRAEFDRLPFEDNSFDLVVFNASLHYSEDYERTLGEAIRVLDDEGRIVVLDTPMYHDASSGGAMLRERSIRFARAYGTASSSLRSEGYLTDQRLRQLAARCGITWSVHRPSYGLGWIIRRGVSKLRNRREPARFAVIDGTLRLSAESAIEGMVPRRSLQGFGRIGLRIRYVATQQRMLQRTSHVTVAGLRLDIPARVFHPTVFRSGAFLAQVLFEDVLPSRPRVLDLGCGSGICALAAAKRGADVTASDVNPEAVSTTRHNASLNSVDLVAIESDLFQCVGRFDVVLFNPPYFAGAAATPFELAWRCEDLVERFSRELCAHLRPDGFALVVLSTDGRGGDYLRRFEADGHRLTRVADRRYLNETLTVFRLR